MKSSQVMAKRSGTKALQKHSPELKISMARVIEEGKSQTSLAQETGISITNIYKWTQLARAGELVGYVAPEFDAKTGDIQTEVRRLTRALAEMTAWRDFLKNCYIFRQGSRLKFEFIRGFDSELSIRARCEALDVTEQKYHAFVNRLDKPSAQRLADDELLVAVIAAHAVGRQTYGTPRLKVELENHGIVTSRRRIARLRYEAQLQVKTPRSYAHTTDSNHDYPIAPNLLNREFAANCPNSIWVSDITYLTSADKFVYLCTIIDCFSGAIVARQLSTSIDSYLKEEELVGDTLATMLVAAAAALRNRGPVPDCIFHSDRGSQYASNSFREALAEQGMIQSMSRKGNCWDNAVAESFFARTKVELGDEFENDYEARTAVYEYIDVFYNFTRIHSRHDCAPMRFERQQQLVA